MLGFVALLTVGSVGTGSIETSGPITAIGVVSGAVQVAPSEAALAGSPEFPATPVATIPDARLALPGGAPPISSLSGYRWPLLKGRLTQDFGPTAYASRIVDGKPFHDGIDLATFCGDSPPAATSTTPSAGWAT